MKIAKFKEPIFRSSIILTFGTMEEMSQWYKDHGIDHFINPNHQAFTEKMDRVKGGRDYHIHFDYYGFTAVVHETNHVAFNVLSDRGIPFTEENKEVFAYYQDWIAGKCRDYLEKWTKPLTKDR